MQIQIIIPPEREGISFREVGFKIADALKKINPNWNVSVDPWTKTFIPNIKLSSPIEFATWDLFIFPMTIAPNATTLFAFYASPMMSKKAIYYGVVEGKPHITEIHKTYLRNRVVTPSKFSAEMLTESGIKPVAVIPHGFDLAEFKFNAPLVRSIVERFKNRVLLYYVSSGIRRKGITPLIQAMSIVAKKHPEAILYLDVLPQFVEEHWKTVKIYKLEKNVVIEGNFGNMSREQIIAKYYACDLYVHPAFSEGFGMPIVEAELCAKPVVAVDAPPMNEHIDEKCGWLVPYDHIEWENYLDIIDIKEHVYKPEVLAEKLIEALDNPKEITEKGYRAYKKAAKKYNYLETYRKFLDILDEIPTG